jgi:pimeloyl-ACP methyl ester carboxylesterase
MYLAADPKFMGKTTKLRLLMHGAGAFFSKSLTSSNIKTAAEAYSSDFLTLVGDDPSMTWHFGFADQPKANDNSGSRPSHTIVKNYTQYRYWCMIRWLTRGNAPWKADSNEIFAEGHSMGGTGAMEFAIHHPEIFAYISSSSEGINNWKMGQGYEGDGWVKNFEKYIGLETQNFPYKELISKDKLILDEPNGFSTWGWLSMRDSVVPSMRNRDDLPYLNFNHGTQDGSIDWEPQGAPVWYDNNLNPFAANLYPYTGGWMDKGHSNSLGRAVSGRSKLPKTHFVLAFKNSQSDDKLSSSCIGVATCHDKGQFNLRINWSTERDPVNGPPIDSPNLFETTLKLNTGGVGSTMPDYSGPSNPIVDITPRRLQRFPRIPMADYAWENIPAGGGAAIQSGTVTADEYGIFTIPGFRFTEAGNKLRITTDAATVSTYAGQKLGNNLVVTASPNPFRTSVDISMVRRASCVVRSGQADIRIFNIKGNLITTFQHTTNYEPRTKYTWDASGQPAGIYIIKVRAGEMSRSVKIMLVE